jgi:hypothetical protein
MIKCIAIDDEIVKGTTTDRGNSIPENIKKVLTVELVRRIGIHRYFFPLSQVKF